MTWLALFFALELGFLPNGHIETYEILNIINTIDLQGEGYVDLSAEVVLFDVLFIGGGVKTYVWKYNKGYSFTPNTAGYSFVAGFDFGPVEVGYRHYYYHPVMPWAYYAIEQMKWEGAYDEIYLRIEGGFGGG